MGFNVLVVDDSTTVRAVIAKTLRLARIPVGELHEAGNGQEALAVLADNWIDLVFADINMPVMGGVEMIEKMSENDLLETTPVIIVSTEGSAERIAQMKEKGVSAYIRKPFTPKQLREAIGAVMGIENENTG